MPYDRLDEVEITALHSKYPRMAARELTKLICFHVAKNNGVVPAGFLEESLFQLLDHRDYLLKQGRELC